MDHLQSSLQVNISQKSDRGLKPENQDTIGARVTEGSSLTSKGIALAVADGVSSSPSAKQASQTAITGFLTDYFATPDSWSTHHAATTVIHSLNRFLWSQSRNNVRGEGWLTTFSSLILKGQQAFIAHIGDSRVYRIRGKQIEQITTDHTQRIDKNTTYLSRALGADLSLDIETYRVDVKLGDIFLLSTDGIHESLTSSQILEICLRDQPQDDRLNELFQSALKNGSTDNLSAQLVEVLALGTPSESDAVKQLSDKPFPPLLEKGQSLDGYTVIDTLHESERSQVYLVEDAQQQRFVMKTPSPNYEDDPAYIERFIMESWIGIRIQHANVVRVVQTSHEPSHLYYLTEHIQGPTLSQIIKERGQLSIVDAVELLEIMIKGTRAFHRKDTLHQDLKPDNIVISKKGPVILDFGSCWVAGLQEISAPFTRDTILGTLLYSAPEYRCGGSANQRSDQFSLAVMFYEMLTGKHPYGETYANAMHLKAFQRLSYIPARLYNPLIPHWIDKALEKALRLNNNSRYSSMSEWLADLKRPNPKWLRPEETPLIERHPLLALKLFAAAGWLCTLALLVWVFG